MRCVSVFSTDVEKVAAFSFLFWFSLQFLVTGRATKGEGNQRGFKLLNLDRCPIGAAASALTKPTAFETMVT